MSDRCILYRSILTVCSVHIGWKCWAKTFSRTGSVFKGLKINGYDLGSEVCARAPQRKIFGDNEFVAIHWLLASYPSLPPSSHSDSLTLTLCLASLSTLF